MSSRVLPSVFRRLVTDILMQGTGIPTICGRPTCRTRRIPQGLSCVRWPWSRCCKLSKAGRQSSAYDGITSCQREGWRRLLDPSSNNHILFSGDGLDIVNALICIQITVRPNKNTFLGVTKDSPSSVIFL